MLELNHSELMFYLNYACSISTSHPITIVIVPGHNKVILICVGTILLCLADVSTFRNASLRDLIALYALIPAWVINPDLTSFTFGPEVLSIHPLSPYVRCTLLLTSSPGGVRYLYLHSLQWPGE